MENMINAFRTIADTIELRGYSIYDDEAGIDVHAAADVVAGNTGNFTDEIEAAFAGWLLLRGHLVGTFGERADALVAMWEHQDSGRTGAEVVAQFRLAAEALAAVAHLRA